MQRTVADMTDAELDAEFDRFVGLRDAYQAAMKEIREEKAVRLDRETARLRAELAAKS